LIKVLRPIRHKKGHFGDVLPSQSLSTEETKQHNKSKRHQNKIVLAETEKKHNAKPKQTHKTKPKPKTSTQLL